MSPSEYYVELNKRRNKLFEDSYDETIKYVEKLKEKHDSSIEFINGLENKNKETVKSYIIKLNENKSFMSNSVTKTLILIDGTGSMRQLLEKTKQTLETMFNRAFSVLNSSSKFSIKIAVYRNYDAAKENKLIQNSNWESEAENLVKFLQTVRAEFGLGNEAIEIGFWQANREVNLSQVILIGDAAPNTENDVQQKRLKYPEGLRKSVDFANPVFYLTELHKLVAKNVIVNAIYLKNIKKDQNVQKTDIESFQEIARLGKGKYEYLDLFSSNSSQLLIDLITQQVLFSIGGEDLIEVYRSKFC